MPYLDVLTIRIVPAPADSMERKQIMSRRLSPCHHRSHDFRLSGQLSVGDCAKLSIPCENQDNQACVVANLYESILFNRGQGHIFRPDGRLLSSTISIG